MSLYSPENDGPAEADDVRRLFTDWRSWLIETGDPASTNQAPLGVNEYSGTLAVDREVVPLAPEQETYRRQFADTAGLLFLVPRAAAVLGLRDRVSISYFGAVLPTPSLASAPGSYRPATCLFTIPDPALEGIDLRVYRLTRTRDSVAVRGTLHDRPTGGKDFLVDQRGAVPEITVAECETLAEVGRACMMFSVSDREGDRDSDRNP
jgi:hypothetical protein